MANLQTGIRYQRPPDSGASWYYEVLGRYMKPRLPRSVTVQIEILGGGGLTVGKLHGVGSSPTNVHGAIEIESREGDLTSIPCEDIEAITILQHQIDTSDELRG
jgi:hypothetical protein